MKAAPSIIATVAALAIGGQVLAADEPEHVLEYRKAIMGALNSHAGAIVAVLKGEVGFTDHVADHARSLAATSQMLDPLFPPGSGKEDFADSRALPKIWADRAEFENRIADLQRESARLAEVAQGGDMGAIAGQLQKVGKACGDCHKAFREKKD